LRIDLKNKAELLFGNQSTSNKLPLLNKIIAIYIGITLVFQISSLIAPVLTALTYTPLYSFKTYLGIIGAGLIAVDLITNKVIWRGAYCWLLYGIVAVGVISSVFTLSYGISENIFLLCWVVIEIALFYSLSHRLSKPEFTRFLFTVYTIIAAIWLVACVISVAQFVAHIRYVYVVDPISADKTLSRQGFAANRLFGIFNPINHAAYISLMLIIIGIYLICKTSKKSLKIFYSISCFFFLMHIILSVSRSALLASFAIIAVASYLLIRNRLSFGKARKILVSSVCSILVLVISFGCYTGIKKVSVKLPRLYKTIVHSGSSDNDDLTDEEYFDLDESEEELLDRDLKEDSSNGRLSIWGDYISLYKKIGAFGFSPGNYMTYIKEHYPDLYIVDYIKNHYPAKYEADVIYHVHNGYLMVFVSTGFIGIILLIAYLALCALKVLKYILSNDKIDIEFVTLFSIVIAGCVAAFFDRGIFLSDNGQSFIFWIAAGALIKKITPQKQKNVTDEQ